MMVFQNFGKLFHKVIITGIIQSLLANLLLGIASTDRCEVFHQNKEWFFDVY
jgi:hypothetical protein